MVSKIKLKQELDTIYEEILIGFILELRKQNVSGREIGRKLVDLTELMEVWDA